MSESEVDREVAQAQRVIVQTLADLERKINRPVIGISVNEVRWEYFGGEHRSRWVEIEIGSVPGDDWQEEIEVAP